MVFFPRGRTRSGWRVRGVGEMRTEPRAGVLLVGHQRTPAPAASGRRESRDGVEWVVCTRRLAVPREEVWSALTDPARLGQWVGTFRGDPTEGLVEVVLDADGEDLLAQPYRIERVVPTRSSRRTCSRHSSGSPGLRVETTISRPGTTRSMR